MTKRDFFRIVIKMFGLYAAILTVFTHIPVNLAYIFPSADFLSGLVIGGITVLAVLIFLMILFKADYIIDLLKLDKGFDEEIIYLKNFTGRNLIKISLIIIGGLMLLNNFSKFLTQCFFVFKSTVEKNEMGGFMDMFTSSPTDYFQWIMSGLNLVIGYFLVTNYNEISEWLTKKLETDK